MDILTQHKKVISDGQGSRSVAKIAKEFSFLAKYIDYNSFTATNNEK
jgi:hypothetical protein